MMLIVQAVEEQVLARRLLSRSSLYWFGRSLDADLEADMGQIHMGSIGVDLGGARGPTKRRADVT
jgi:hypothetical protein